jgi:hypothetical protein
MTAQPATGAPKSAELDPLDPARLLYDAELLLEYAAESGIKVDHEVADPIVAARSAAHTGATDPVKLLQSIAILATKVSPVTADSLRTCLKDATKMVRWYRPAAILVALLVIGFSAVAFLISNLSQSINQSLDTANTLAVKLRDELGPGSAPGPELCKRGNESVLGSSQATPSERGSGVGAAQSDGADSAALRAKSNQKDVIADLQKFAMAVRQMHGDANSLNSVLPFRALNDPFSTLGQDALSVAMELPPSLRDLSNAAIEMICVYQKVRYYAQHTERTATLFSGVLATVLPVLYALLGACANLLRRFEAQRKARTLTNYNAHHSYFVTAAITGAVVGLFSFGRDASVSPFAIAFLAGYGVDVFFSFLESLIQTFSRTPNDSTTQGSTPAVK